MNLREALSRMASSVCVATAGPPGHAHGVTLTSVVGLAVDPALLGFALMKRSRMLAMLQPGSRLGIAVLAEDQQGLATGCATPGRGPVAEHLLDRDARGTPIVASGAAAFRLRVVQCVPAGDHAFVVASVEESRAGRSAPLLYFGRRFSQLGRSLH
jgi:flavin reductase (DIM6/NTAB) family NADH-FMN oxidoreductase RutF